MPIQYHPPQGSVIVAEFFPGFKAPEMVKKRLVVVLSPEIKSRSNLCTIVPLSTTAPNPVAPYHCELDVGFEIPQPWGNQTRWVKGDMVYALGFHRLDLLRLSKDGAGRRQYQTSTLDASQLKKIRACVLHGMGLSSLTKKL